MMVEEMVVKVAKINALFALSLATLQTGNSTGLISKNQTI